MKIISDFDGVLTDQTHEGHRVHQIFESHLSRVSKVPSAVATLLEQVRAKMKLEPSQNGWRSQGRISAFANEDLFIETNGMGALLDQWADAKQGAAYELRLMLQDHEIRGYTELAQTAYLEMVKETQQGKLKPMVPEAADFFGRAAQIGAEVVIVSNSSTQRILELLKGAGVAASEHGQSGQSKVRVRGAARKFDLAAERKGFQVGSYFVETHRPHYEAIIEEENPDLVIGDVFTLDLATPYRMMRRGRALLRLRGYTPEWSRSFCAEQSMSTPALGCIQGLDEALSKL